MQQLESTLMSHAPLDPLRFKDLVIAALRKELCAGRLQQAAQAAQAADAALEAATHAAGLDPTVTYTLDETQCTATPTGAPPVLPAAPAAGAPIPPPPALEP